MQEDSSMAGGRAEVLPANSGSKNEQEQELEKKCIGVCKSV